MVEDFVMIFNLLMILKSLMMGEKMKNVVKQLTLLWFISRMRIYVILKHLQVILPEKVFALHLEERYFEQLLLQVLNIFQKT